MEGSLYALSMGVSGLAGSPASSLLVNYLSNWWNRRKLRKRVFGLIMNKGVSTLCTKLSTKDVLFLDCDKLFQTLNAPQSSEDANKENQKNPVDVMLSYPIIRNHVVNVSNVYKGKIILVSKSLELLKTLPVKEENIYYACFSRSMEENIKVIFSSEKEHHESEIEKYRILREIPESHVYISDSLAELYKKTEEKFGVERESL